MSLKKDIVIVNEYSTRTPSGGSRGGTPGSYVTRYMARGDAVEKLTPIRKRRIDNFILRYMSRKDAVEKAEDIYSALDGAKNVDGMGGVGFGYGSVSLSDDGIRSAADDIQKLFDKNHTVMKIVLSFSLSYLKKHGLVEDGTEINEDGDYKGKVDQLRLRAAIMRGMDKMGERYDDLRYIGTIQFDTKNVHAHLAAVDAGKGRLGVDGRQRGKLLAPDKSRLRRGIDSTLDQSKHLAHMASHVSYDRRNVRTNIKKWAAERIKDNGVPQFLIATLPEDKNLWRAGTYHESMRKANAVTRGLVTEILEQDKTSGWRQAQASVANYARYRQDNEGLSMEETRKLIRDGENRIIEGGMNAVYGALKALPDELLYLKTPTLDVMGMDFKELEVKYRERDTPDPIIEFGFKLRSYSSKLKKHTNERTKYREYKKSYEDAQSQGMTNDASLSLYYYYILEEEYQAMLAAKYRHLLPFLDEDEDYEDDWQELNKEYGELIDMQLMMEDPSLKKMRNKEQAEAIGVEVYGHSGAGLIGTRQESFLESRLEVMRDSFEVKYENFTYELAMHGARLEEETSRKNEIGKIIVAPEYEFDDVKALDLHHLSFDFSYDAQVSYNNVERFLEATKARKNAYDEALDYLKSTGQEHLAGILPGKDVDLMVDFADRIKAKPVIEASRPDEEVELTRRSSTINLGLDSADLVKIAVRDSLREISDDTVTRQGLVD